MSRSSSFGTSQARQVHECVETLNERTRWEIQPAMVTMLESADATNAGKPIGHHVFGFSRLNPR
ncbi:MAG TPA: hypothetical protein VEY12_06250 [Thermoplasmata archaeon]|nr:hypothetical protein [Thermoplasmata archaeon]